MITFTKLNQFYEKGRSARLPILLSIVADSGAPDWYVNNFSIAARVVLLVDKALWYQIKYLVM
jgi:hypothetical protein